MTRSATPLLLRSRSLIVAAALLGLSPAAALAQTTADVEAALRAENWEGAASAFEQLEGSGAATADDYRMYATRLFRAERGDEALAVLQRGVTAFPDATRFHYMIGTLHRNAGRCSEAIRPFERFLDAEPSDPDALAGVARCYERVGRSAQATDAWERYLAAETRADREEVRAEAEQSLARLRGETPEPAEASPAPADASPFASVASGPAPAAETGSGSVAPAQPVAGPFAELAAAPITVAVTASPGVGTDRPLPVFPDAAAAIAAGDEAASQRDWHAASDAWAAAAQLDESSVEAWYRAGVGAAIVGDAESAAVAFRRAQALAPEFAAAADRATQADARAEHEAQIALDRRGWHTDAGVRQVAAAEAYAGGRWLDGMRAQLASDAAVDPLVIALRARAEGRTDEAAEAAMAAIAVQPEDAARFLEAADARRLAGDLVGARYLLGVYQQLGGAGTERMVAVRAALERAERR